jgi:hypothetical protein
MSAISPTPPSPTHLSGLGSPQSSLSNQIELSPEPPEPLLVRESMENDFSGPDYGNSNLDEYKFDYQDFYLLMDSFMNMDPDYALSNDGSQEFDGQIMSGPNNSQLHREPSQSPQVQSSGSPPPPSPSLSSSSFSATDDQLLRF